MAWRPLEKMIWEGEEGSFLAPACAAVSRMGARQYNQSSSAAEQICADVCPSGNRCVHFCKVRNKVRFVN